MFLQHLDDRPRDAKLALDGLVGIGGRTDVELRRLVAVARQGFAQSLGGIDFRDDPRLEVEAGRKVEVAVGGAGVTVDAAKAYLIEKNWTLRA